MQTAEIKADWNRRVVAYLKPDLSEPLLRFALRYAALNAPVADGVNLFRLLDAAPEAQGTLVPDHHAPAGLPRVDVVVRVPRQGKVPVPTATSRPGPTVPVAPPSALPEGFRAALQSLGTETLDAAEILAQVSDEETSADYEALRAAAAALNTLAGGAGTDPVHVLVGLEAAAAALAQARAANELASFVLGSTGDDLARRLSEMSVQAGELRDRPPVHVVPAVTAPVVAASVAPLPEWEVQRWVDLTPCVEAKVIRGTAADRREAISRAGMPDDLEDILGWRLPEDSERTAAAQLASFIIASAGGLETGELPTTLPTERMGDVLAAGVDAAVGWLRPILRSAGDKVGYGDSSWRIVPPAPVVPLERPVPPPAADVSPALIPAKTVNRGDWIEWDEDNGETRRGQVDAVWEVGRIIPGQRCVPHEEYSVKGMGTIGPDRRPRQVSGPREVVTPNPVPAESPADPAPELVPAAERAPVPAPPPSPATAADNLVGLLTPNQPEGEEPGESVTPDPDEPDVDELEAEAEAEVAQDLTEPVDAPLGSESVGEEISATDLHAGTFRAWFLTATARDRVEAAPWSAFAGENVGSQDYALVAEVRGAHAHEVFARLQNGFADWADAADPGAVVRLNLDVSDGRLRRRSMDYGDLLEDAASGQCQWVGADDLHVLDASAAELGLTAPAKGRWQTVVCRPGFADPLVEEPAEVVAGELPAVEEVGAMAVAGVARSGGRRR